MRARRILPVIDIGASDPRARFDVLAEHSRLGIYSSDVVCIGLNQQRIGNRARSPPNYTLFRDSSDLEGKKLISLYLSSPVHP